MKNIATIQSFFLFRDITKAQIQIKKNNKTASISNLTKVVIVLCPPYKIVLKTINAIKIKKTA